MKTGAMWVAVVVFMGLGLIAEGMWAAESLVIAASPSLREPIEALGRAYEQKRQDIRVKVYFDSGLDLRRTIAAMEHSMVGQFFIGTGPIHLVAPGGDELIDRLEQKYYVLRGTRRSYLVEPLVMVVPVSQVDAPASLEALKKGAVQRVAVADFQQTQVGKATAGLFQALGLSEIFAGRLDVAADAEGVIDHVVSGQADVGILFGAQAIRQKNRVRIVAVAPETGYRPIVHSMAMERYCPNRGLCENFLSFIQTPEAQAVLRQLGYGVPKTAP